MNQACQQLKASFARNEAVCNQVNHLFHLLSNKGRFRIVCLLCLGEFCVNDIAEVIGQGRLPNVSQHLKTLALSGVIERRRESQRILYRLKDERVRNLVAYLRAQFLGAGAASAESLHNGHVCQSISQPFPAGTAPRKNAVPKSQIQKLHR